jgi:FixJ family two-component response regulator
MPEKEGLETILEMRRQRPTAKILAISGGARIGNVEVLDMAAKLGADCVLAKPFDDEELSDAIAKCLSVDELTNSRVAGG